MDCLASIRTKIQSHTFVRLLPCHIPPTKPSARPTPLNSQRRTERLFNSFCLRSFFPSSKLLTPVYFFAFCHSRMVGACHMQTIRSLDSTRTVVLRLDRTRSHSQAIVRKPVSTILTLSLCVDMAVYLNCWPYKYWFPHVNMMSLPILASLALSATSCREGQCGDSRPLPATCISGTSRAEYPQIHFVPFSCLRALERNPGQLQSCYQAYSVSPTVRASTWPDAACRAVLCLDRASGGTGRNFGRCGWTFSQR